MTLTQATKNLEPTPEEKYRAMLRSLRRTKGFGILFLQCSPAEATRLITKVKQDLPQKKIEVLQLAEPIDNLYELIANRTDRNELNILFIQGIERSLEPYIKPGYGGQGDYYNLDTVPRILVHLNQQRERFRDDFGNICFVFIVPLFAIKYFIHRAPDFFDWRSGVYAFPTEPENYRQKISEILEKDEYYKYLSLTQEERDKKILEIREWLEYPDLSPKSKALLLNDQGRLFYASGNYEAALKSYEKALEIEPNRVGFWRNCGLALYLLGRFEEAISCFDQALEQHPENNLAAEIWFRRGLALYKLGRYEEVVTSYEEAIKLKPNYQYAWYNRGLALSLLGNYEEAALSYCKAIKVSPSFYISLLNAKPTKFIKTILQDLIFFVRKRPLFIIISAFLKVKRLIPW